MKKLQCIRKCHQQQNPLINQPEYASGVEMDDALVGFSNVPLFYEAESLRLDEDNVDLGLAKSEQVVQHEEDTLSDDTSCDVQLEDGDNDIHQDDEDLDIRIKYSSLLQVPRSKRAIPEGEVDILQHDAELETMGYNFDIDTEYEDSDEIDSLDEDSGDEKRERFPKFNAKTDMKEPTFKKGMIFASFDILKKAVRMYSIKHRFRLNIKKNDLRRLRVTCKEGCPWLLYAAPIEEGTKVQIRTYIDTHSCSRDFSSKHATFRWIAEEYLETIRSTPDIKLSTLMHLIKEKFSIDVPKTKVHYAKQLALDMLRGDENDQFLKLADYGGELRRTNPGSTLMLSLDNLIFRRVFVCISACKNGFKAACRPIINIDGCFLKGRYGGQLLSSIGIDPNDCIWPIAYAVVESECKDSWTWFLHLLRDELDIENSETWTFMSDRQKGLIPAIRQLYPNVEHRFCVRHLISNFKKSYPGETLKNTIWAAAKSSKSDILLNNISECFNRFILDVRDKPILTMLEIIRTKIMVRIARKRTRIERWTGSICPKIQKKLDKIREESKYSWPSPSRGTQFQVSCPYGQFVVDLAKHTCSCRKWQLTGIPCSHSCAALAYNGNTIEDFIDRCYTVDACKHLYDHIIKPTRSVEQWEDMHHNPIQPPNTIPPKPGRPKKKRRRSAGEREPTGKMRRFGMGMHCSNCGGIGHNKRACKNSQQSGASRSLSGSTSRPSSGRERSTSTPLTNTPGANDGDRDN